MKINKQKWWCSVGQHEVIGGNRYANRNGTGFDCEEHTPYLGETKTLVNPHLRNK